MKNSFLEFHDKSKCCGCNGCVQACPCRCLTTKIDHEGFSYPILVKEEECIKCGKCRIVCPMEKNDFINSQKFFVGAVNRDRDALLKSSSGGVFIELARHMINRGGVVYGVALSNFKAIYQRIDSCDGLCDVLGSKYIQANSENVYEFISKDLKNGVSVFVCSTPCFIAGLKKFLGKKYDTLLTADLICHGVPSQKIFDKYINWLKQKKGNISDFAFRDKSVHGWGVSATYKVDNRLTSELTVSSPYIWAYLKNYLHRPSCYECPFAVENRPGDITVGDFWEMDKVGCSLDYKDGISLVKINNDGGMDYFEEIKCDFEIQYMEYNPCIYTNGALYEPSPKQENRDLIYENIDSMTFDLLIKKYFNMPNRFIVKIKRMLPQNIKNKFKSMVER